MEPSRSLGRGRGLSGRGRISSEPLPTPGVSKPDPSTSSIVSQQEGVVSNVNIRARGRGRGKVCFPKELLQDEEDEKEARTPLAAPLREREDPADPEDSEDEDDFITAFRKLHPVNPTSKPQPQSVGFGSGRGVGRGRGSLDVGVLDKYPVERGVLSSRQGCILPSVSSSNSEVFGPDEFSEIEKSIVIKIGKHGERVHLCANFVNLKILRDTGLYEYHTYFDPPIESKRLKWRILRNSEEYLGKTINFDGAKLYLPIKLPSKITEFNTVHPSDPALFINIKVKFVKLNSLDACVHFYNILLRKIMLVLGMAEMNRNFFDYENIHDLPIHKLQIWPGYVTAVDLYEGGLMLCCDSSFKVLRTDTMFDALHRLAEYDYNNHQEKFKDYALRKIVLTRYNNKNYRIDDVDWTRTPRSTFVQGRYGNEKEVSFVQYYKENYDVTIRNLDQPMLITRGKIKRQINDLTPPSVILLVPELCYVTGLTEEITSDYRIMKDIAQHTRISPQARYTALLQFVKNVNDSPPARQIFQDWGLELDSATVSLEGRVIKPPVIIMNKNYEFVPPKGDFSREVTRNIIYEPVHVNDWLLLCVIQDEQKARRLLQNYQAVSQPLGISYRSDGRIVIVGRRGTPEEYRQALVKNLQPERTQFVIAIVPSARDDVYSVIKIICNREIPVPSQVIRSRTLADEKKGRSVMQKIALQINCKLGGSLWCIKIPLPEKIMFIGMDVYHDPSRRNASVTGICFTINPIHTKFYSRVIFQSTQQESISSLRPIIIDAFEAFYEENNGVFPDRVVVFRDGLGDGQLEITREHEVVQMMEGIKFFEQKPKFTFCVVQKRINARMYLQKGSYIQNPEPGTVLDHTVTRRHHFDFFLVSQLIREGTVNPTHYVVLYDDAEISPDMMQKFAYATSYMYYNWAGSIRVPAMCQYAHKLAGLVGQHMRIEPSKELSKQLYFL